MAIVIMLFILVAGSIIFSAWKNKSADSFKFVDKYDGLDNACSVRKCITCGHEGEMKTWIANNTAPKFFLIVGFLLGYLPGLIFLAFYWGKYKCPNCGAIGKNQQK